MPYRVVEADLTQRHTNYIIFHDDDYWDTLIVLKADDTCYLRINNTDNDKVYCYQNLKIQGLKITDLYLINEASSTSGAKLLILLIRGEL